MKGVLKLMQAQNSLADLETRVGEYSWPISLPKTRQNCLVFDQKQHVQGLDKFRQTDYPYRMRVGSELFAGTFRLSSIKNGFTGNLLGDGFSWAVALGTKKLTDLRFTEVSYDGSQLEAMQRLDCEHTDIQFPLVAYGNFFSPPITYTNGAGEVEEKPVPASATIDYPLSVDDYYYGVYYRNIIRQIFREIGWHVRGRILDSPEVRQWVMLPAGGTPEKAWPWGALLPAGSSGSSQRLYGYYDEEDKYQTNAVFDEGNDVMYYTPTTSLTKAGGTRAMSTTRAAYTAPVAGWYNFSGALAIGAATQQIHVENTNSTPYRAFFAPVVAALVVFRSGTGYSGADGGLAETGTFYPAQDSVLQSVRLDVPGGWNLRTGTFPMPAAVYLEPGDTVRLCIFARRRFSKIGDGISAYTRKSFSITCSASFACTHFDGPLTLQPALALPPLGQKEVVADFMLRTNTVPVADLERRVVTLMSREEQKLAAGPAVELTALVEPEAVEFAPVLGEVGAVVFSPAQAEDADEKTALITKGTDVVRVNVGSGSAEKAVGSLFAPVVVRPFQVATVGMVPLPVVSDYATLQQPRSEVDVDVSSYVPRVVRYLGPDEAATVPFQLRRVPVGRAVWDGLLRWEGPSGAVQVRYAASMEQARRGHLAKCTACVSPTLYRALQPGKAVYLSGSEYEVSSVSQWDAADEAGATAVELVKVV